MRLPLSTIWSGKSLNDPSARIDRYLADRVERLSAGLFVCEAFDSVSSALVITRGRGKFLRVKHAFGSTVEIPSVLSSGFRESVADPDIPVARITQLVDDLTEIQTRAIEQLKQQAGKYVDRLLTVSVLDPGLWITDFDGHRTCTPLCNATSLAASSGITVIDAFAQRDINAGGQGSPLEAIPLWLMFSDRDEKIARTNVAVLSSFHQSSYFSLPASDGLDAEIPGIQYGTLPGAASILQLVQQHHEREFGAEELRQIYAGNEADQKLMTELTSAWQSEGIKGFDSVVNRYMGQHGCVGTTLRTTIEWLCRSMAQMIRSNSGGIGNYPHRIILNAVDALEDGMLKQLESEFSGTEVVAAASHGFHGRKLDAVAAAVLGMMNVDQFPANVPWLTGAEAQRILGRLTPGNPSNWRQLLRDMADFQPPAMKLRDAV